MPYRITEVLTTSFPSQGVVDDAMSAAGLTVADMRGILSSFVCSAPLQGDQGYQISIAHELERYLAAALEVTSKRLRASRQYHPSLNEEADIAIEVSGLSKRIYVELEFRPNVEKDLVKFQIGANSGLLLLGILIVAIDRRAINASYTSMPEYRKFAKVISALAPSYPLLLCGIRGAHEQLGVTTL